MNSGELKKAKRAIRNRVRLARDRMEPAQRAAASIAIADRFMQLPEVKGAGSVMLFWSFGSEADTTPLMEALWGRGVTVALPRIVGSRLEPRTYAAGDPVTATTFGAMEPSDGIVLPPEEIDVVATPGVAFDASGARVGYGGGFYDRFFGRIRPDALRAGVCFDLQLLDEPVPGGAFDIPVDVIVTESGITLCARR